MLRFGTRRAMRFENKGKLLDDVAVDATRR
jgi:hypothetical protein